MACIESDAEALGAVDILKVAKSSHPHHAWPWISFELVVEAGEPKMDQGGECAEHGAHGSTFNRLC